MMSLKKWILAPVVAFGLTFAADSNEAKAQFGVHTGRGISISFGSGHYSHRPVYGYNYRAQYGHGYGGAYRSYRSHRNYGHYDYYPTRVIPHGNHYDVIPGHYSYHYGHHHVPRVRHRGHGHH